jgi:predicted acetyltransferase
MIFLCLKYIVDMDNIIFESLDLHPEFIGDLEKSYWNEWSESLKKEFNISEESEYHLCKDIIYFIGFDVINKKLVSSIAITPNDLGEKTDLSPWLSYVYVVPEYRNKGIAQKMITWYLENVLVRPLYLWCKHPLETFYNKFGFEVIENRPDISIMEKRD